MVGDQKIPSFLAVDTIVSSFWGLIRNFKSNAVLVCKTTVRVRDFFKPTQRKVVISRNLSLSSSQVG